MRPINETEIPIILASIEANIKAGAEVIAQIDGLVKSIDHKEPKQALGAVDLILSWLLTPNAYEVLSGDLIEAYRKRLYRDGKHCAVRWCIRQLLTSIPPLIWQACRRLVYKRGM
jgi:hypothetical protein